MQTSRERPKSDPIQDSKSAKCSAYVRTRECENFTVFSQISYWKPKPLFAQPETSKYPKLEKKFQKVKGDQAENFLLKKGVPSERIELFLKKSPRVPKKPLKYKMGFQFKKSEKSTTKNTKVFWFQNFHENSNSTFLEDRIKLFKAQTTPF